MTNEELVDLIKQGIDTSNNMEILYTDNKRLIYTIIKKYRYACQSDYNSLPIIEMDELMQEAYFGLVRAIETYNPEQGILFMTYAENWIRQVVKRYLDNCGRVIRVPVNRQAQVYQYNKALSYYLSEFNREPTKYEYAVCLEVSEKVIESLEKFMFNDHVKSLDAPLPGGEDESVTLGDALTGSVGVENEVIERVSNVQLQEELWDVVDSVLKDDKKVQMLKYRYIENLTLEEIAVKYKVNPNNIRQFMLLSLRRLSCNSKTKRMFKDYLVA